MIVTPVSAADPSPQLMLAEYWPSGPAPAASTKVPMTVPAGMAVPAEVAWGRTPTLRGCSVIVTDVLIVVVAPPLSVTETVTA